MSKTEVPREAREPSPREIRPGETPGGTGGRRPAGNGGGNPREIETALRRFSLGGPEAVEGESAAGFVPAALHSRLARGSGRGDYPLFLALDEAGGEPAITPFPVLVREAIVRLEREGEALEALEWVAGLLIAWLRASLAELAGPKDAARLLEVAKRELLGARRVAEGEVPEGEREELGKAWEALLPELPRGGFLIDYGEHAALHLLLLSAKSRLRPRREAFERDARDLASRVRGLLRADMARGDVPDRRGLGSRIGTAAASRVDPAKFAEITRHRHRSEGLGAERRQRLEDAAARLESLRWESEPALVLVHDGSLPADLVDPVDGWTHVAGENPCSDALEVFVRGASAHLDLFRAARVARAELAGRMDPERHLAAIESLGVDGLREAELGVLPVVVAIDEQERVTRREAAPLSRLLLSGWPVQLVVTVEPGRVPFLTRDGSHGERLELAYLGLAHRNAFVQQSASARPGHLTRGFLAALARPRPGLHVLARAQGAIESEAALESRAHPFFRYDPDMGRTWAGRMDFSENPEPDSDWVARPVENPELLFTFVDYALLSSDLAADFRPIPEACPSAALVALPEYLELEAEEQLRRIPFVCGVDEGGCQRRLAVTRRLARVATGCLDFWWTLRELAGVRNAYVEEAVRLAREEAAATATAERERLTRRHGEELERARREAVEQAITNVVRGLLDPASLTTDGGAAGPVPALEPLLPATPAEAPGKDVAPAAKQDREGPWIESVLCTSCNDCIDINSLLFVYDANKQARIGDPAKGTFAQLVKAAEVCPARCIHPGAPLNPSEKNLEALRKRAEPFR